LLSCFSLATSLLRIDYLCIPDATPQSGNWRFIFFLQGENAMEVTDAIQKRTTIRRWQQKPVEKEKIEQVLEAGRRAPSWGNVQPWRFVVVRDKTKIEELAKLGGGQPQISTAPAIIVCCGAVDAFSRKMHRESLKQLIQEGVMDWPDELLDNVILENDQFAPYRLGEQAMKIKAGEQLMIAIAFMTLEAINQGLGSCWAGAIAAKEAQKLMRLPDNWFIHDYLVLGYPDENPKPRPRKPVDETIFWEEVVVK
jgi:nitroreductase